MDLPFSRSIFLLGCSFIFSLSARASAPNALEGVEEIVFAVRTPGSDPHWYANFGYWSSDTGKKLYGPDGGRLCKLNVRTKAVSVLLDDPGGSIRDPHVHYNGTTILFSYRPAGSTHFNLYEIESDGRGLRRVTDGPYDDIEPTYLPGGDIVFCSSRCHRWVGCWHTQVAIMHRAARDGTRIRPISSNCEHDNTPAVLPDGRLLYTRWEYVDRNQVTFHHLWTANPDGTAQMTLFGNLHPGIVMIDAKAIPGTDRILAIFSPGHGRTEHAGTLTMVDPRSGPDEQPAAHRVTACPPNVRDPYPLSKSTFLVARGHELLLVESAAGRKNGKHTVLYSLAQYDRRQKRNQLHEPAPLRPRSRERIVPDRSDETQASGYFVLQDVRHGRNMGAIEPGEIKKLLVIEVLPKPVNFSGGPDLLSWLGTFSLERALGTVPVEPDGSAYFEAPAHRSLFFVALDANDLAVKRMQSFVSVMPGETAGCIGCHEHRTRTPPNRSIAALGKPPHSITPIAGVPDVVDFERDIQPILDKHCVACHTYDKREGGVVLAGDRGLTFSHSYWSLMATKQVSDGRNAYGNRNPRAIGSAASALMAKLTSDHHRVALSEREQKTIWLWIETGAVYAGTYAALGNEGPSLAAPFAAVAEPLARRCSSCHTIPGNTAPPGGIPLPAAPRNGPHFQRVVGDKDPIARRALNILFNFTRPEKSPLLLGPLARKAGGYGTCGPHKPVFADTRDRDYQILLSAIRQAKQALDGKKRYYMTGFRPNEHYLREMKRFGVLPPTFDAARETVDVYALDRRYWQSLWHRPQ